MKLTSGKRILIVITSANADQLVHTIVIGRKILVPNRPWDFPPVPLRTSEIHIRVAKRNTAPNVRFAAASPYTNQLKGIFRIRYIRLLFRIEVELRRMLAGFYAVSPLPRFYVRPKFGAIESGTRIQHQHGNALACEIPSSHSAGCSAANHDDVVNRLALLNLHRISLDVPYAYSR